MIQSSPEGAVISRNEIMRILGNQAFRENGAISLEHVRLHSKLKLGHVSAFSLP